MQAFTTLDGIVVPLDRANVDTDALIPKHFIKSVRRSGFGPNLFDEWRYLDQGDPSQNQSERVLNPDFVLNQERYAGATILLTRQNFGCGSSREHAVWALENYGFRAIIAPSFADIFFGNCFKNGILPIVLGEAAVDALHEAVQANIGYRIKIDLPAQTITLPDGEVHFFVVDAFQKHCLIEGLDDIALTLTHSTDIAAYEVRRRQQEPWLFGDVSAG
ncbi:3-isopropylmalate dehydratase small subunit [Cupriavidus necator]|uniref:3-isopropylmalate dehydratase small subunit n=1 Tax=Cupriavidus necator TaxID=106590 RepID=UPI0039C121F6